MGWQILVSYIYIHMRCKESGLNCWGIHWPVLVILVLPECIWNVPAVKLILSTFEDTSSLGPPPHQVVYPPGSMVPPWVTASHFLVGIGRLS